MSDNNPSAAGQATRAQNRGLEAYKARLETLETRHKTEVTALTERTRLVEADIQGLREAYARLESSNDGLCRRVEALESHRIVSDNQTRLLTAKLSFEASRLDVATADLEVIAPGLTIKSSDEGPMGTDPDTSGLVASGPAALDPDAEAEAAILQSKVARDADPLKDAVGSVLFSMYRVNNFKNIADKHYPYVPEDHDEWPHTDKPDGGRENHMRLNFEEKFDSDTNWPMIERWRDRVRQQGGIRVAGAQAYLEVISDDDLLERVKDRFKWECRTYKRAMGDAPIPTKNRTETGAIIAPEPIVEPNPAPLTQEEIATKSAELATMATATRQGFQQTKCETRMRKRQFLKGEEAKYLDTKYDSAFALGAQSEDDYEVESVNGHEPRKTGRLVSRAWWYESAELRDCKAAVDAVADPKPQGKRAPMPSVRGPTRPGSPRPNKKLENKMRRWMVDSNALQANEKWMTSGRVVEDDATEQSNTHKKRKASKLIGAQGVAGPSDKGKQARHTLETRGKLLKEELGDLTFEELLAD